MTLEAQSKEIRAGEGQKARMPMLNAITAKRKATSKSSVESSLTRTKAKM